MNLLCFAFSVGGSYSARVPRSSAEVHREFVHHILEDEVDGQKEGQGDKREDGEENEKMELSKREINQRNTTTMRMKHGCHGMSADPNLSHACACELRMKNGRVRCCIYTPRRLQQTAVSCKRSNCNKINKKKNLEVDTSEVFVKRRETTGLTVLSCRSHLWTFLLIVMSSTRNRSIATKCWRKNSTMGAIAGISRMALA